MTFTLTKWQRTSEFGRQGLRWYGHNLGAGVSFNPYFQSPTLIFSPSILEPFSLSTPGLRCQRILRAKMIRDWPAFPLVLFFILCFSPGRCFPGLQGKSLANFCILPILILLPKLIFYWYRCCRFSLGQWILTRETIFPPKVRENKFQYLFFHWFLFSGLSQFGLFSHFRPWWPQMY